VERICDRVLVLHEGRARAEIELHPAPDQPLEDRFLGLVSEWGADP
jgi:hypothetical protein